MNWVFLWLVFAGSWVVNATSVGTTTAEPQVANEVPMPKTFASELTTNSLLSDPAVRLLSDFGPLSPLAMSPFFGVTVLSGLAQLEETSWGSSLLSDYTMVASNPVLKHPATFWIFLALTLLSSLPRLTKVSKPVAQALDWVESYSVLLITLIMFGIGLSAAEQDAPSDATLSPVQAGLFSLSLGVLLMIAAVVNFMVVKSVRFMFELLIWLSPVPFVDAVFEVLNKTICLGLLILYAVSPMTALIVNLFIFAACVIVYRWAKKRLDYHWHFWVEPWWQWLFPAYRSFDGRHLWCYAEQDFGPFQKYDLLQVYLWEGKWMIVRHDMFWRKTVHEFSHIDLPYLECTNWKVSVVLQQQVALRLATHRGYKKDLDRISAGLELSTQERLDARDQRQVDNAETQGIGGAGTLRIARPPS